jgi:hypothetical protein
MQTVTILPESDDVFIFVRYSGIISKDDYQPFLQKMRDNLKNSGRLRVLVVYEDFKGWEMDAADVNFKSILEEAARAEKIAYVNPPPNKIFQMKISSPALNCKIKFFDENAYEEACEWIKNDDD